MELIERYLQAIGRVAAARPARRYFVGAAIVAL